ncbi:hypothetical protein [Salibacterium halotolerans]|uniref:hypothetical protein n=1 Tax=Salibacterium halotolerans TaxID=1884432 RepID=UPI001BAE9FF1|nr:hypothetical protein [Salibacterium halotolerans]
MSLLPDDSDDIEDEEKTISVEQIVQELIQKYKQDDRGPIPGAKRRISVSVGQSTGC